MFKTLVAVAAALTCITSFQMPAEASNKWTSCAFHPKTDVKATHLLCRRVDIANKLFKLEWADGKSDIFHVLDNGMLQDSRGGLWETDAHVRSQGMYFSAVSFSSGMIIVWKAVSF